ncbi:MAG: response regulator [Bryobacterales bacterium]|nr:response regulator [Bryobacterales bacterium]
MELVERASGNDGQSGNYCLYLIDDDLTSLNFMGLALRKYNGSVHRFSDPVKAIASLEEIPPDIVITDLVMPKLDGFGVMAEVRKFSPDIALILLTGQSEVESAVEAMKRGACDYVTKPVNPQRLQAAVLLAEQARRTALRTAAGRSDSLSDAIAALQSQIRKLNDSAQRALIVALDARERETRQHSVRVSLYATHLAQLMGLDFSLIREIQSGALLHDIGKIGVPDSILNKPGGLTDDEWMEMRKHPEIGYSIVKALIGDGEGARVVLCHHERYDGSGYPIGLKGGQIPLGARLFAVVDAYDALTSSRPYRERTSHWEAMGEITRSSRTHFDPDVVSRFVKVPEERWLELARCAEELVFESEREYAAGALPFDAAKVVSMPAS